MSLGAVAESPTNFLKPCTEHHRTVAEFAKKKPEMTLNDSIVSLNLNVGLGYKVSK